MANDPDRSSHRFTDSDSQTSPFFCIGRCDRRSEHATALPAVRLALALLWALARTGLPSCLARPLQAQGGMSPPSPTQLSASVGAAATRGARYWPESTPRARASSVTQYPSLS